MQPPANAPFFHPKSGGQGGMIWAYRWLTWLGAPLIELLLWRRKRAGKEDPDRIAERRGVSRTMRPTGRLIWIHAASIGEALSALPLMHRLQSGLSDVHILITTGTVSSARVLAKQLPTRAMHQFVPADRGPWVRRFLEHWRPDMAIWIESEFWPNLILETAARGIPMALVNGRMSARSYQRWRLGRSSIERLLNCFRIILAHDEKSEDFLRDLGATAATCVGDLKQAADPLDADGVELAQLQSAIGNRPVWIAASTHPGEEGMIKEVHEKLRTQFPGLLTIIAPRHADRGAHIATLFANDGLKAVRRSTGAKLDLNAQIYLADTMGEMGLIYRLSKIAFVGGSMVLHGGQNPLEPARLGCAILHGPHIGNFTAIYAGLDAAGAARQISDVNMLAEAVGTLLRDKQTAISRGLAGKAVALTGRDKVLEHIFAAIEPLLPEAG